MYKARPKYYCGYRGELLPFLPLGYQDARRVLEIGCGEGGFRKHFRSSCEYWGVEPGVAPAELARGRLARVLTATYREAEADIPNASFDLIICNDVIEHMPDHDWFLCSIKTKLTPSGYLIGSVPNVRYIENLYHVFVCRDWDYAEAGILDKTHLRYFTVTSLRRCLVEHGFLVDRLDGINSLFHSPPHKVRHYLWKVFLGMALLSTFGMHRDIQFLQIAFRVRRSTGATVASD